jgi:RNA polymerase sigma-70 factor (ECF subfamily)
VETKSKTVKLASGGAALSNTGALTGRMARGEEAAYREFYDAYFQRLFGYLLVVTHGHEEAAREALQATMLRVVRHIKPFVTEEVFWSWLTLLARSSVIDEHRKQSRYLNFLGRLFGSRPDDSSPAREGTEEQLLAILEANLPRLAVDDRDLIQRKYYERCSVKEIAAALGLTEKAVEMRLARARLRLKQLVLQTIRTE